MEILVTGARGFLGRNITANLKQCGYTDILEYDIDTDPMLLDDYTRRCGFVFHLAGVNRPKDYSEYMTGNAGFTQTLLQSLKQQGNRSPVLIASSVQAALDNPYGQSKKAGEQLIFDFAAETGAAVFVYRLPNVFGKWCRPNYNSAVATFCHNIAHGLPIIINDPETVMNLVYIDDVTSEFIGMLEGEKHRGSGFCVVEPVYTVKLGLIAELLKDFRDSRENLQVPNMSNNFTKKLYSTYLSYLPESEFAYPLKPHTDNRGAFVEFLRTPERGQVSVNISRPGIARGDHWHNTKNEKFLVVSGKGVVRFRALNSEHIIEYHVDGSDPRVVDVPPGYTHSIENTGNVDMVTVIWANECFDPNNFDTYMLEV